MNLESKYVCLACGRLITLPRPYPIQCNCDSHYLKWINYSELEEEFTRDLMREIENGRRKRAMERV